MKRDRAICLLFLSVFCFMLLAGCGEAGPAGPVDLPGTQDISAVSVPAGVQVVGLGEASHGVAQYQQLKGEVFRALAEHNGCRTFLIEGDFGGALKVDRYISGGSGTARQAAAEIGFAIYRTQEMADLVDWMRAYNQTVPRQQALHFYGMDMQRFDNSKEYLFSVLDEAAPVLAAQYEEALAWLTDENRASFEEADWQRGKEQLSQMLDELDAAEGKIGQRCGQPAFDFARECAKSMVDYCDTQLSGNDNQARDRHMYEKVEWFLRHGDGSLLFINGHNGHIGKTAIAGYACLGQLLSENLGQGYYAIGTDARQTRFQSQTDEGGFQVMEVSNENQLNTRFAAGENGPYFIDFASVADNGAWSEILNSRQPVTTLNAGLTEWQARLKAMYTVDLVPQAAFDGMIVFRSVTPFTILSE